MQARTLQLVTLRIDNRLYAVESQYFHEALRPGPVTPVPFVPRYIEGLVNIDGKIATLMDIGRLFSGDDRPSDGTELALVDTGRSLCALRVQAVLSVTAREHDSVDWFADGQSPQQAGDVAAASIIGQFVDNGSTVFVLDHQRIGLLVRACDIPRGKAGIQGKAAARQVAVEDNRHVLVVSAGGERYGFAIESITELVELADCVALPGAPAWIAGITQVRSVPHVVVVLQELLGRNGTAVDLADDVSGQGWMLLVERGSLVFGVLVDGVSGIEEYAPRDINAIHHPDSAIVAVLENSEGKLVMQVDPARLLDAEQQRQLQYFAPETAAEAAEAEDERIECLSVSVADELFAIPLDMVSRIIQYKPFESIDTEERYVLGAIDVDGRVVPVINANPDVHDNFDAWSEYIVMEHDQAAYAVRVSKTHEVMALPVKDITASSHSGKTFVSAVAHFEENLYSMFNPEKLKQSAV